MGVVHHIVKVQFSERTGAMYPIQSKHCPFKNGLKNTCVGDNTVRCTHMLEEPPAIKKGSNQYMIHCGYK